MMEYLKGFILLIVVFLFTGCVGTKTDQDNPISKKGYLILFENHEFSYFVSPRKQMEEDLWKDFLTSELDTGFIVIGLAQKLRWDLLNDGFDSKDDRTGLAKVIPVQIKYDSIKSYNKEFPLLNLDYGGIRIEVYMHHSKFVKPKEIVALGKGRVLK